MKTYPVKTAVLFLIAGILTGEYLLNETSTLVIYAAIIFAGTLLIFLLQRARPSASLQPILLGLILLNFVSAGAILQASKKSSRVIDFIPYDNLKGITATGVIKDISLLREEKFDITIELKSFEGGDYTLFKNGIVVRVRDKAGRDMNGLHRGLNTGDLIEVRGNYRKPPERRNPGEFDYRKYLQRENITGFIYVNTIDEVNGIEKGGASFKYAINQWRKELGYTIDELHDRQTAGFLKGLILGDRSEIDANLMKDFMRTGLVHIIAISGLHIIVISLILFFLLQRFPLVPRFGITAASLFLFMFLTGAPAPVMRAVLMGALGIAAIVTNRSRDIVNIVALVAMINLLINPDDLFAPGFQLSYAAVLGLIFIFPELRKLVYSKIRLSSLPRWGMELVLATISAQLAILPLTHYYFGIFSFMSIPANIIAVPLSNVLVANGLVTLIIAGVSTGLAGILAETNNLLTYLLFETVHFTAGIPAAYLPLESITLYDFIILTALIISLVWVLRRSTSIIPSVALVVLFLTAVVVFSVGSSAVLTDGKMSVMMVDVGQGDAFLIKSPRGRTILIDAGKADENFNSGDRILIPLMERLGLGKIDLALMSHTDADHFGGFTALAAEGRIKRLISATGQFSDDEGKVISNYFKECGADVAETGDTLIDFDGIRVYVLDSRYRAGFSKNDNSLIVKLVYGETSFLFTGDAGSRRENLLRDTYADFLRSDVLKVSHHGSKSGTKPEFLEQVFPHIALISAGKNNVYGHPAPEVLNHLQAVNSRVFRSDLEGAVILESDGKKITKKDWR